MVSETRERLWRAHARELDAPAVTRERRRVHRPIVIGDGTARNRKHDGELQKEIKAWYDMEDAGLIEIMEELNSNQMSKLLGSYANRKMTLAEKREVSISTGFPLVMNYETREMELKPPDHLIRYRTADGIELEKAFEHVSESYNSRQRRGKRQAAMVNPNLRLSGVGSGGRRIQDGPDVLEATVRPRVISAR